MIFENPIITKVPVERLKSKFSHSQKGRYLKAGFSIFDVPIKELPHYKLLEQFKVNSSLDLTTTEYYRLIEFADSIQFHKGHEIGHRMCARLVRFYDRAKKVEQEPIEVDATHDGWFVIANGLHRAGIAAALGHRTIPAVIRGVDIELAHLLKMVRDLAYGSYKGSKTLYISIEHPVFDDWKILKDESRWLMMEKEFEWKGKKILDIGSYTGYFSHRATKMDAKVTGIEVDSLKVQVAKQLNVLLGLEVGFFQTDMFDYLNGSRRFDCVFFLEVLHWILIRKGEQKAREALELISTVAPVMFFVMRRMRVEVKGIGPLTNKENIANFVLAASSYNGMKWLGLSNCDREIFKFIR